MGEERIIEIAEDGGVENGQESPIDMSSVAGPGVRKPGRAERKLKKEIMSPALEFMDDVMMVMLYGPNGEPFRLSNPEVHYCAQSDTYVAFGDIGQANEKSDKHLEKEIMEMNKRVAQEGQAPPSAPADLAPAPTADTDAAAQGVGEFRASDIDLVMAQAKCSREVAVAALQKHGDMIDAIIDIGTGE